MKTSTEKAAGELAEPYQLGVGEVERLRGDLLQAANLELRGNPYIAHRKKQINALCDAAKAAAMRTPAPSAQEEWRTVPVVVKTAPERIWLQVSDDRDHDSEPFPDSRGDEVTWCANSVLNCEVEYVRADLATAPPQAGRGDVQSVKAWAIVGPDGTMHAGNVQATADDAWHNWIRNASWIASKDAWESKGYRAAKITITAREEG